MLMAMKDIALSSGSACTSASLEPSYVLRALGTEEDMAHSSIRFGIGRFTTDEEVDFVTSKIVGIVQRLRERLCRPRENGEYRRADCPGRQTPEPPDGRFYRPGIAPAADAGPSRHWRAFPWHALFLSAA